MKDWRATRLREVPKDFAARRGARLPAAVDRYVPRREEQIPLARLDVYLNAFEGLSLDPSEFAHGARGILDLVRAWDIVRRWRREDAWFAAVCVLASPLVFGGSIALIRWLF
jgi:hypothetical protein